MKPGKLCNDSGAQLEEIVVKPFRCYTARDLQQNPGQLFQDAEEGRLSLVTKHGKPAFVGVPFDERLLNQGIHRTIALKLFETKSITVTQAARLAGESAERFVEILGKIGIAAVSYPPELLVDELESLD